MTDRLCKAHGEWPMFEKFCVECATAAMPNEGITCPFCGRKDFDKMGLKSHLPDCEAMDAVENIRSVRFFA